MKRALILGLGESGLAMARWLARDGWAVEVADSRVQPPMRDALQATVPEAVFRQAAFGAELLQDALPPAQPTAAAGPGTEPAVESAVDACLLAVSPGLSPRDPALRALLDAAAAAGVETVGEIELFARALAHLRQERGYAPKLIGITGTNGKTTTTRMVAAMIARWGRSVAVAGNISPSALDALRTALDADALPDFWVLELSSFQLASTRSLACDAAVVLNVTQDHLDWHESMQEYAASKARIYAPETYAVVNRDDPFVRRMGPNAEPDIAASESSAGKRAKKRPKRDGAVAPGASFGVDAPAAPGQFGLVREGGLAWLACTDDAPLGRRRRKPAAVPAADGADPAALAMAPAPAPILDEEPLFVHRLMPADALGVRGLHNAMNALAALALARAVGCPLAPALRALQAFRGEPHRTQTVATVAGVEYVDDSKGTNVGATVAALEGLAAGGRRIVAILGGDGKGQSFAPLADAVRAAARAVVCIGRDAPQIEHAVRETGVACVRAEDLPAAVRVAAGLARPGDIVLLSPACASFDMFRNYAHRAEVFAATVGDLARAATGPAAGAAIDPAAGESAVTDRGMP